MASSNPFASSASITTSLLKQGSVLPTNTHIVGTLSTVLGKPPEGDQPALRFNFRGPLVHDSDSLSDYTIPLEGGSIPCRFLVSLNPGSASAKLVDEAQSKFGDIMRLKAQDRVITLEGGGLLVKSVSVSNAGCDVKLEATGRRAVKLHDATTLHLFSDAPSQEVPVSDTPSWFDSPPQDGPTRPRPAVEPTDRMRRITELVVPSFDFLHESTNSGRALNGDVTRPSRSCPAEEQSAKRQKTTEAEPHNTRPNAIREASSQESSAWTTPFDRSYSEPMIFSTLKESPFATSTAHTSRTSPDARPSPAVNRRQVEEDVRARRRREAEAKRRAEAEAERIQRAAEQEDMEIELDSMKNPWTSTGVSPTVYRPLKMQQHGTKGNIMGIVVEANPPKKPRDWLVSIIVADPTTHVNGHASDDMVVTIFRKNEAELPSRVYPGCPILFRSLSFNTFRDKIKGNGYSPSGEDVNSWAWMGKNGEIKTSGRPVSPSERGRLQAYKRWWTSINGETPGVTDGGDLPEAPGSDSAKKGPITLAEAVPATFFEATVKIVYVQHNPTRQPKYELYVTDGTVHTMTTRNFHGVGNQTPPNSIFCLAVFGDQPAEVEELFLAGNVLRLKNVLCKIHTRSGELELKWSEKVLPEQRAAGWQNRSCSLIPKADDKVRVINTRINALKRGEIPPPRVEPKEPVAPVNAGVVTPLVPLAADSNMPVATHLSTTFTDPTDYPINTLEEIIANKTVPNKYRARARVKSIHARIPGPDPVFVQYQCTHCRRQFTTAYCQSCNDAALAKAEIRYRLVAVLEQGSTTLPILIADDDAAAFLPPLPPLSHSSNPNDRRKTDNRLKQISNDVVGIILGAKMDGQRTRPVIDWTIEAFEVGMGGWRGKGKGGKSKDEKRVLVYRAFGMRGS